MRTSTDNPATARRRGPARPPGGSSSRRTASRCANDAKRESNADWSSCRSFRNSAGARPSLESANRITPLVTIAGCA